MQLFSHNTNLTSDKECRKDSIGEDGGSNNRTNNISNSNPFCNRLKQEITM